MNLPRLALSVRQPWAWAIIHAGKDMENRDWRQPNPGLSFRGAVAIHAGKGMTRDEYEDAAETIHDISGLHVPKAADLVRGGILGVVDVVDIVRGKAFGPDKPSPWFFGPLALVLRQPVACSPVACPGQLGFFEWQAGGTFAEPAKWMLRPSPKAPVLRNAPAPGPQARAPDLFDDK